MEDQQLIGLLASNQARAHFSGRISARWEGKVETQPSGKLIDNKRAVRGVGPKVQDFSTPKRLLILLVVWTLALPWINAVAQDAKPCPDFQYVPHQGSSCPTDGGWLVQLGTGRWVLTHGPDALPPADAGAASTGFASPVAPRCVSDPTTEYHGHVIYARPIDRPDRYNTIAPQMRGWVAEVNGKLRQEAAEFGVVADYKFRCAGGQVEVANEVLLIPSVADSFSTITTELQRNGYTNPKAKYWVWVDATELLVGGQGTIHNDHSPGEDNQNNQGGDFALTYGIGGFSGPFIMMHENGHNIGAVQLSSPNTSGGFHCNDGQDVMCYADGGAGSNYNPNVCVALHYDCNHNDYFRPYAPAGTYLANYWNIGSTVNHFILYNIPTLRSFACSTPVELGTAATCSLLATDDDSTGVRYTLDWGDGTIETVPASGYVTPGVTQTATHTYASIGLRALLLTVVDNASPALPSDRRLVTAVRTVSASAPSTDVTPPTLLVVDPEDGFLYDGCASKTPTQPGQRAAAVRRACVRANATDTETGVDRVEVYYKGQLRGTDTEAPYELEFWSNGPAQGNPVRVVAVDVAGNSVEATRLIDALLP